MNPLDQPLDTFPKIFRYRCNTQGRKIAIRKKEFGIWNEYTWEECYQKVKFACLGLVELGMKHSDKISIIGDNDPQWLWGQLGAWGAGGVVTGLFSDATPIEIKYILEHSECRFIIANDQEQVDKLLQIKNSLPLIQKIIYWDPKGLRNYEDPILISFEKLLDLGQKRDVEKPDEFDSLITHGKGEDVCLLLYTSGTTGLPKGVMISHKSMILSAEAMLKVFSFTVEDDLFSAFPAAWMGEQLFGICNHLVAGCKLNYPEEPESVQENMREISPTLAVFGPRQWEGICSTIRVKMEDADWIKRSMFKLCLPMGQKVVNLYFQKKKVNLFLRVLHVICRAVVFNHLLDKIGMRKSRVFITGSAALSPDTFRFLHTIGVKLRQAYAGTEFCFACGHLGSDIRAETLGPPASGIKIQISPEGEILIGGETIFKGYYKDPESTLRVLKDGWFHTGDAGHLTEDGHLVYLDRVSELGELADGTRYAPQYIEGRLRFSPYLKDALVVGSKEHEFVSAVLNINFDMVGKWAETNRIAYTTFVDLSQKEEVAELILNDLKAVNSYLPLKCRIKKFVLLHKEFDPDEGELTRTRKLRRRFMEQRYDHMIEAIYKGEKEVNTEATVKYRDGREATVKTAIHIREIKV